MDQTIMNPHFDDGLAGDVHFQGLFIKQIDHPRGEIDIHSLDHHRVFHAFSAQLFPITLDSEARGSGVSHALHGIAGGHYLGGGISLNMTPAPIFHNLLAGLGRRYAEASFFHAMSVKGLSEPGTFRLPGGTVLTPPDRHKLALGAEIATLDRFMRVAEKALRSVAEGNLDHETSERESKRFEKSSGGRFPAYPGTIESCWLMHMGEASLSELSRKIASNEMTAVATQRGIRAAADLFRPIYDYPPFRRFYGLPGQSPFPIQGDLAPEAWMEGAYACFASEHLRLKGSGLWMEPRFLEALRARGHLTAHDEEGFEMTVSRIKNQGLSERIRADLIVSSYHYKMTPGEIAAAAAIREQIREVREFLRRANPRVSPFLKEKIASLDRSLDIYESRLALLLRSAARHNLPSPLEIPQSLDEINEVLEEVRVDLKRFANESA
jgi:hypothetical protein